MNQDLFDWLNSQTISRDKGLLIAPIPEILPSQNENDDSESNRQQKNESPETESAENFYGTDNAINIPESNQPPKFEASEAESQINFQAINNTVGESETSQQNETEYPETESAENFYGTDNAINIPESNQPPKFESSETESQINFQTINNAVGESEASQQNETEYPGTESAINFYSTDNTADNPESSQQEENEPAINFQAAQNDSEQTHEWQERATGFTLSLDEPPPELWTHINDDDPDPEYEPTESLQGAAYVQIHGRNFTERLHHTLRTRKERMQSGSDDNDSDGAISRMRNIAVMLCSLLVMALGLSCIGLYFVWRMTFYRPEGKRAVISNADQHIESVQPEKEKPVSTTQSKDIPRTQNIARRSIPKEKPKTFTDYLNEGNYAYNIGMYNRAVINFWNAKKINGRDIRPYLGLSACYRKKGMYVDAHYVIEEARRLFGRSPAVDMAVYFLREAQRK